jgi:bacteriorhodopsin
MIRHFYSNKNFEWGYYAFGCAALLLIAWNLVVVARRHAMAIGSDVHKTFIICGVWTTFLWFLYPISWGLCEGGNVIGADPESIFYGVLDIMAKPVFGALLIWGHRGIDPSRLGLHIRDYEEAPPGRNKEGMTVGPQNGHANGHANGE